MTPLLLAANWKLNVTPDEAREYAERFRGLVPPQPGRELVFFPTALTVTTAVAAFRGRDDVRIGVQDVYWEPKGAFTGAISAQLAAAAGATAALVGHSERRHVFGETDADTRRKVRAVLDAGLTPFLCVGERLEERERGQTEAVVIRQLDAACADLQPNDVGRLVLAYEPVWAIGTGKNATPEDASQVHRVIRSRLGGLGGERVAILYGGSVNPKNARALLSEPAIDGVLVGGSSLDPETWAAVIEEADQGHQSRVASH